MNFPTPFDENSFKAGITSYLIDAIPVTDSNFTLITAARARLHEAQALASIAAGLPWPFAPALSPLSRAVDDFIQHIETLNVQPLPADAEGDNTINQRIQLKEDCLDALDQAKIAAITLMTHLNKALWSTTVAVTEDFPVSVTR